MDSHKLKSVNAEVIVSKDPSMFDSDVDISIKNLVPLLSYTLHSTAEVKKDCFECFAQYIANAEGVIDLSHSCSFGGSFKGVQAMGLFWAMQSFNERKESRRLIKRDSTPLVISISVVQGWFSSLQEMHSQFLEKKVVSFSLTRLFMAPGVRRIEVTENGLRGTLFLPPGKGPFPGIINMYGGIPGSPEFKPALFASHGFATLALAFYGVEGLPETWFSLKMEYFEAAVKFLRNHKYVHGETGIGIVGVCKGGQIALCMADCLSGIKCVVTTNCALNAMHNDHSYRGKVWKGMPVATVPTVQSKNGAYSSRDTFHTDSECSEFQSSLFHFYERSHIAFMYIAGLEDCNVPSDFFCNLAEKLLSSANHPNYIIMRYPGTGHLIEPPYNPLCPEVYFKDFDVYVWNGGKPMPHCRAQVDAWSKQLQFLRKNLLSSYARL